MTKDDRWMQLRCGRITASELGDIMSASGGIIDGNLAYIRSKRFERKHGYSLPVSSRPMEIGNETEPMIFRWAMENRDLFIKDKSLEFVYSKDLDEVPFWIPEDVPNFGASPDAFSTDESVVIEFKTLVGNEPTEFFMDDKTSAFDKNLRIVKEHGDQLIGQFISNPKTQVIHLIKYAPQRDDVMKDCDSPLAPWRGYVFTMKREDSELCMRDMVNRIKFFNALIDSDINPRDMKSGWSYDVTNDRLVYSEPEPKPKKK